MLPIPLKKFIPKMFLQRLSPAITALIDKIESNLEEWKIDAYELQHFNDPARVPTAFIEELGALLDTTFISSDSERVKRQKIATTINDQKFAGSWNLQVKDGIGNITGITPELIKFDAFNGDAHWILRGGLPDEPDNLWSILGVDGVDYNGILLEGANDEIVYPGNIYINIGIIPPIDTALLEQLIVYLEEDISPAYTRVYLGYKDPVTEQFTVYSGGIIG